MSPELNSELGAKLLTNLDQLLKQGKDDSLLLLFNTITERILKGGWRGECNFLIDEFKVRKVQFVDSCNLDLIREEYRQQSDKAKDESATAS